jgi:hypothetical protein
MLNVIQHFLTFLLYIVHGPLIVISNSSFTWSMPTSMAYWLLYILLSFTCYMPTSMAHWLLFFYRSLVLCPHPWFSECDIYCIVHLFYVHIHGSLIVISILSFTCSMPTSISRWVLYILYRSLVLCSHPWLSDCDIYFIVHLFYAHIDGSLIVISFLSFTCSMSTSIVHWLHYKLVYIFVFYTELSAWNLSSPVGRETS